jgi:hypothetical protein
MASHERFYWIFPLFPLSQWLELTSTHSWSESFSHEAWFIFTAHALNHSFRRRKRPWNQALRATTNHSAHVISVSGVEKLHSRKHKNIKKDSLQLALALLTKHFTLNFTLNQSLENAKQHTYIIYFENSLLYSKKYQIVKYFCHFIQKKNFNLKITVYAQREPAFSVGQFLILHVKSMFGKYRWGVAAQSTTSRGLTPAGKQ